MENVKRDVQEINDAISRLSARIRGSLSTVERSYYDIRSKMEAIRAVSSVEGDVRKNNLSEFFADRFDAIARDIKKASLAQLKADRVRLANLHGLAKDSLNGSQQGEGVYKQYELLIHKLDDEITTRKKLAFRIGDFLKKNSIDAVSITGALTTRNPLIGLGIKYFLERRKALKEQENEGRYLALRDSKAYMDLLRKQRANLDRQSSIKKKAGKQTADPNAQARIHKVPTPEAKTQETPDPNAQARTHKARNQTPYSPYPDTIIDAEFEDVPNTPAPGVPRLLSAAQAEQKTEKQKPKEEAYDYNQILSWAKAQVKAVSATAISKAFHLKSDTANKIISRLKGDGVRVYEKPSARVLDLVKTPAGYSFPGMFTHSSSGPNETDQEKRERLKRERAGAPKLLAGPDVQNRGLNNEPLAGGQLEFVRKIINDAGGRTVFARKELQKLYGKKEAPGFIVKNLNAKTNDKGMYDVGKLLPQAGLVRHSGADSQKDLALVRVLTDLRGVTKDIRSTMVKFHHDDHAFDEEKEAEAAEDRIETIETQQKILGALTAGHGNALVPMKKGPQPPGLLKQGITNAISNKLANKIPFLGGNVARVLPTIGGGAQAAAAAGAGGAGAAGAGAGAAGGGVGGGGGMLARLAGSSLTGIGAGLLWAAADTVMGALNAKSWGVGKGSGALGGLLGGNFNNKVVNSFANAGKWALLGATLGAPFFGVGAIAGGIIGGAFGAVLGLIGGERIAGFMEKTGIGRFVASTFSFLGKAIIMPFKQMWKAIKMVGLGIKFMWRMATFTYDTFLAPIVEMFERKVQPILKPLFDVSQKFFGFLADIADWFSKLMDDDATSDVDNLLNNTDNIFEKVVGSVQQAMLDFAAGMLEKVPSWVPGAGKLQEVAKGFREKSKQIGDSIKKSSTQSNSQNSTGSASTESTTSGGSSNGSDTGRNLHQSPKINEPISQSAAVQTPGSLRYGPETQSKPYASGPAPTPSQTPGQAAPKSEPQKDATPRVAPGGAPSNLASMGLSNEGLDRLAKSEGFSATPYWDHQGYSIGYGHLIKADEQDKLKKITKEEAKELLRKDVSKAESAVKRVVKVPLTQQMFDSLVDFTYNLGPGALNNVAATLNTGDYSATAKRLQQYNKIRKNGQLVEHAGLTARRAEEAKAFSSPEATALMVKNKPQQGVAMMQMQKETADNKSNAQKSGSGNNVVVAPQKTNVNNTTVIAQQQSPRNTDSTFRDTRYRSSYR